jgi:preprotein translocase subunit YajC
MLNSSEGGQPLVFFVLVFAVFWFFMIRPQVKKQKEERKYREAIKKGDKIITTGGIHGKVVEVADSKVKVEVCEGVKIYIEKTALIPVQAKQPDKTKKD